MPQKKVSKAKNINDSKLKCGIVMPISIIDGCSEQHWSDVLDILNETIESAGFEPNLVSNADDVGIIQKRIIQNLYENPIVVCDVSGKNPNVMFELGMRLAFDKPTIIVKDDQTAYSFDTAPIEHISYPRDLRFNKIIEFKKELKEKIVGTIKKAEGDSAYSTFLRHFGQFTVAKIDTTEISKEEYILEEIKDLRHSMMNLLRYQRMERPRLSDKERTYHESERTLPKKECIKRLEEAFRNVYRELKDENILPENITADNYIIERILNQNSSPSCFRPDNQTCRKRLENVIALNS